MSDPTRTPVLELADALRDMELSATELLDACLAEVDRLNGELNAVVYRDDDAVRATARDADERLAAGDDAPFLGVPMPIKDLTEVHGWPLSYGSRGRTDEPWEGPSELCVDAFQRAGFVVACKTNTPEFGHITATENLRFGPSRNPWDPQRTPGGSSGGAASATAGGMFPAAHANDGGGSIRIPASECGLVGLKPTRARVSQGPLIGEGWAGGTIDGSVARTVRDAAGVLDVISARMPGEPYYAPPLPGPLAHEVGADPGRLRIGVVDHAGDERFLDDPQCRAAVAAAARLLESLGHHVAQSWPAAMFEHEFTRYFTAIIAADTEATFRAFEAALGRPIGDAEIEPRNAAYRQAGRALGSVEYLQARQWIGEWARRMATWWDDFDLLLTPTLGAPPPELGWFTAAGREAEGRRIVSFIPYTAQFNMTGQPAVSLPLHWTPDDLPVGVQLVAGYGREDVLVRVASQIEHAAPWAERLPRIHA